MSDRDPKAIHEFEQMTATLIDMARMLSKYREELENEGFTREESVQLCVSCQDSLFTKARES